MAFAGSFFISVNFSDYHLNHLFIDCIYLLNGFCLKKNKPGMFYYAEPSGLDFHFARCEEDKIYKSSDRQHAKKIGKKIYKILTNTLLKYYRLSRR